MIEKLRELHERRRYLAELKAKRDLLEDELVVTALAREVADIRAACASRQEAIASLEGEIKDATLSEYQRAGEKHPWPGVTIKTFSVVKSDDLRAERWCRKMAPCLLLLDTKAYAKAFPYLLGAPGCLEEEPRAQIDTDLTKASCQWEDELE